MDADLIKLVTALALIGVSGGVAVASGSPARPRRVPRTRVRPPLEVSGAAPPPAEAAALPFAPGGTRPRIFTGEPSTPDAGRPALRRAVRLIGGMTALAAAGAIGVLALVRAMVELFGRVGG